MTDYRRYCSGILVECVVMIFFNFVCLVGATMCGGGLKVVVVLLAMGFNWTGARAACDCNNGDGEGRSIAKMGISVLVGGVLSIVTFLWLIG